MALFELTELKPQTHDLGVEMRRWLYKLYV